MTTNYKLKCQPEDFEVTEVPVMPNMSKKEKSTYTYIWLRKTGLTTFDAQEEIGKFFEVNRADIGAEGLKDEDAITSQIISIKKILSDQEIAAFNQTYQSGAFSLTIQHVWGHGLQPVRARRLHGNSFKIIIRDLPQEAAQTLHDFCAANRHFTYVNYYDNQRFGMAGGPYNTPLIGQAIIEGNWPWAYDEYRKSGNAKGANLPDLENEAACKSFFKSLDHRKVGFFVSSYNSRLWNQAASAAVAASTEGNPHYFDHVGDLFVPTHPVFKHPNLCTTSGYGISGPEFEVGPKQKQRNVAVTTCVYPLEIGPDELHPGQWQVKIEFFNPTGCYATMLIKQLILKKPNEA